MHPPTFVVVSVDHQFFPPADGHLGNVGHQISGDSRRVLPYPTTGMGPNRIKVPQQHHAQLLQNAKGKELASSTAGFEPAIF